MDITFPQRYEFYAYFLVSSLPPRRILETLAGSISPVFRRVACVRASLSRFERRWNSFGNSVSSWRDSMRKKKKIQIRTLDFVEVVLIIGEKKNKKENSSEPCVEL